MQPLPAAACSWRCSHRWRRQNSLPVALTERRVAPSILSADFARLGAQVKDVLDAGARVIHVDVMDGHFVPPITFGAVIVSALADLAHNAGAILDVHMMVERPERQIGDIIKAGADSITVHVEATPHLHYTLATIREADAPPARHDPATRPPCSPRLRSRCLTWPCACRSIPGRAASRSSALGRQAGADARRAAAAGWPLQVDGEENE